MLYAPVRSQGIFISSWFPWRPVTTAFPTITILLRISSSCLKLHHSASCQLHFSTSARNLPFRPLLIKHSVSALLASNRITFLERHLGIAVATQIVDSGIVACQRRIVCAREGRGLGGDLVGFSRHVSLM